MVLQLPNNTICSGTLIERKDNESAIIELDQIFDDDSKRHLLVRSKEIKVLRIATEEELKTLPEEREYAYHLRHKDYKDTTLEDWMTGEYDGTDSFLITKALRLGLLMLTNENELINPVTAIARILVSLTEPSVLFTTNDNTENITLLNISRSGMGISGFSRKDIESVLKYISNLELT